ncbi:hypothetical protein GGS23DRAFT_496977 [Durotheca rogersii]|uniref:uncharacterized protein n=1 Tax=Durotheca rogersii TaxID=419775 RepID=UPI002220BD7B|nr:uncharacterized protein GGS23DRAFT_496977 [Durotheca rogersii]KAI5864381.1 hypothetical protein GGS23DRAFT_496977 [Durotheca rogersii]
MCASHDIELANAGNHHRSSHRTSLWRGRGAERNHRFPAMPSRIKSAGGIGLASLPLELQFLVISQLDLVSLVALRQTSALYRQIITAEVICRQFIVDGQPDPDLRSCCVDCLCMPGLDRLMVDTTRESHPWRSICFRCWRARPNQDSMRKHWPLVEMVNGDYGYVCQFCTWPVHNSSAGNRSNQMHAPCRVRRLVVLLMWLIMAIIQFGLGMLALVLAWTTYRSLPTVLIPATIDFGLAMVALCVFFIRISTSNDRTYIQALATELIITIIRIPPVTYTARETVISESNQGGPLPKFGFGVFLINLIFRILDLVGYSLLNCGYDPRNIFLSGLPLRKKILYGFCTFMVWFAFIPF